MANPIIHVAIPAVLAEWIEARTRLRGEENPLARSVISELWRFYDLTISELAWTRWTLSDLRIISKAMSGAGAPSKAAPPVGAVYGAVFNARRAGDIADDAAVTDLLDRLSGLSPTADMALAYAVALWWDRGYDHTLCGWRCAGVIARDA